jgi:hypothetical protein
VQKSCVGIGRQKGVMGAPSVSQERVTDLLMRWSDGDDAALAELVLLVSAPIRSRLDKRFLRTDVGYLNFAPRYKKRLQRGAIT